MQRTAAPMKAIICLLLALLVNPVWAADEVLFMARIDESVVRIRESTDSARIVEVLSPTGEITVAGTFHDSPVALMPLTDIGDVFATLWTSGSAYVYRVFSMNGAKPMLLEAYSTDAPPNVIWPSSDSPLPLIDVLVSSYTSKRRLYFYDDKLGRYRAADSAKRNELLRREMAILAKPQHALRSSARATNDK